MSNKNATVYILVTVLVIWWFLSYRGTVDVGPNATVGGKEVSTTKPNPMIQRPANVGDAVDPDFVDSLPANAPEETYDVGYVTSLGEDSNPLEPPRFRPEGG